MPSVPFASAFQSAGQLLKRLTRITPKEVKLTVGLDIGSTSVKVVALGPRKGTNPRPLIAKHLVPVTQHQEADPSDAIKAALSELRLPVPVRAVNLGVSGQWVIMRVVEMPTLKPAEMKQALPFEAQRSLPFNIQDVVVDGEILGPADAGKMWVLMVACKKDLLRRRIDWVREAGLDVALIDVDALAVANGFLAHPDGRRAEETQVMLNVGAQLTSLIIFQGTIPYLVRDIPWGAEKLSRHVAEQTGIDAATVRQQVGTPESTPEFLSAMKVASEVLATDVQLSFDYFENRFGRPPDHLLVSGGLGESPVFLEALKTHFTQSVSAWTPLSGLSGQFAVAYGLALRDR